MTVRLVKTDTNSVQWVRVDVPDDRPLPDVVVYGEGTYVFDRTGPEGPEYRHASAYRIYNDLAPIGA